MRSFLGKCKRYVKHMIFHYFYRDAIKAYWYQYNHNFGDILNPLFIHTLTGKKVIWVDPNLYKYKNYIVIGSILDRVNTHSIVWGAGFISKDSECSGRPARVCAVRGPLTRQKLLERGIKCPEIYGDPALLLPKIYVPKTEKKYKIGIVAHYIDRDNPWLKQINTSDVLILDIQSENPYDFIDQIYSCEKIVSSSLHGIIVADAYGIPSLWLEFSDKVVGKGFKFLDYFLSVKRIDSEPIVITQSTTVEDLFDSFIEYEIDIDLSRLIEACPFDIKDAIKTNMRNINSL